MAIAQNTRTTLSQSCWEATYLLSLKLNIEELERQQEPLIATMQKRNFNPNSGNLQDSMVAVKLRALNAAEQYLRKHANHMQAQCGIA